MEDTGRTEAAVIRPMQEADLGAVAEMLAKLADHVEPGFVPLADLASLARYGPTGLRLFDALVATRDGRFVGLCLYTYAFSSYRGRPGVFVQDLFVEPSERGTGLGRALLAAALRREAAKGCTYAKLEVHRVNSGAIAFYQRLGFAFEDHDHRMVIEQAEIAALLGES